MIIVLGGSCVAGILIYVVATRYLGLPYNIHVQCSIGDGSVAVEVVTYDRDWLSFIPHVGSGGGGIGVRVREGPIPWDRTWLIQGERSIDDDAYARRVCARSIVADDVVVYFPVLNYWSVASEVNRAENMIENAPGNSLMILRPSSEQSFSLVQIYDTGGPYLVTQANEPVSTRTWATFSVELQGHILRATQGSFELKAFEAASLDWSTKERYWNMDSDRSGCSNCEPLLKRTIVSTDWGKTWQVEDYKTEGPLPPGALIVENEK